MTGKRKTLLQIPQGTEAFYLEEAFRHRRIITELDRLYESWGYLPVYTPVFDFFDTYKPLLNEQSLENVYRLIDREGDLLMLRSDITLFLAKQMGLALRENDLPVRVYYSDVILRHQNKEDISRNEFFQSGVEIIGKKGRDADLEVVLLLAKTLERLGVSATMHIGSHALFAACSSGLSDSARRALAEAIATRDERRMFLLFQERDGVSAEYLTRLFQFIGSGQELRPVYLEGKRRAYLTEAALRELKYLHSVADTFLRLAGETPICIDLSEIGGQPYYTGIVFQVYMPEQDAAIASGGRYDRLLEFFGFPAPSVGFSLQLRKVEPFLADSGRFGRPATIKAAGAGFEESFRTAEELRKAGKIAVL